ncbi:MAG: GTPase [Planctomycetales bacterium]
MLFQTGDTIAALASAPGSAVRGILRVSGPQALSVVSQCIESNKPLTDLVLPTRVTGEWRFIAHEGRLPVACYCWPDRRSFTGEPSVEIHTLGAPPLLEAMLAQLFRAGARPAQRGEFTFRAFVAGKLDLMQAEALLGVIQSQDADELQTALTQLAGGVSQRFEQVRNVLLDLLADLEAELDFSDEGLEFVPRDLLRMRLEEVLRDLERIQSQTLTRNLNRPRKRVIITGPANVGKSTLFNALCAESRALVSEHPGTTRDYLSAEVSWDGIDLELIDTAGEEIVPDLMIRLSLDLRDELIQAADLELRCSLISSVTESRAPTQHRPIPSIAVLTQCDRFAAPHVMPPNAIFVSAQTGMGLQDLRAAIRHALGQQKRNGELIGSTAARCEKSLEEARQALSRALENATRKGSHELLADDVRTALETLGELTGAWTTNDLLDRIFSRFCIGK